MHQLGDGRYTRGILRPMKKRDDEHHEEDKEDDLRDVNGGACEYAETKDGGDERDNEECDGPG